MKPWGGQIPCPGSPEWVESQVIHIIQIQSKLSFDGLEGEPVKPSEGDSKKNAREENVKFTTPSKNEKDASIISVFLGSPEKDQAGQNP